MDERDPTRLSAGADARLASLIEAGKGEIPAERDLSALAAKLGIAGGLAGGGSGAAAATGAAKAAAAKAGVGAAVKSAGMGLAAKIVIGVATVGAIGGGGAIGARYMQSRTEAPRERATMATPASVEAAPRVKISERETAPPRIASARVEKPVEKAEAKADPVEEEKLLGRAQAALERSPGDALALAEEHARVWPRGGLAQERELIAIDALARLGRTAEARARAERFERAWPTSAHLARIREIVK